MSIPDIINTIGASLMIVAFFLLTLKKISSESKIYNLLNVLGSGLACYGAFIIGALPFVALEGIWCLVAVYGLLRHKTK